MTEKAGDGDGMSRRGVLKQGAAGASLGIAGFAQPVLAKRETEARRLAEIERRPAVQDLLEELGYEEFPRSADAETMEIEGSDLEFTATTVDFGFGTLKAGTIGETTTAAFEFHASEKRHSSRSIRKHAAPSAYDSIPEGTDAWLLEGEDEPTFLRTATDEERGAVLDVVPASDSESTLVYTKSDIEGFHVDVLDPDDATGPKKPTRTSKSGGAAGVGSASHELVRYEVPTLEGAATIDPAKHEIEAHLISGIAKRLSSPAGTVAAEAAERAGFETLSAVTESCGPDMLSCALGILLDVPSCMKCAPACTAGMGVSGGAICFLCVFGICSWMLTGLDCVRAVDCIAN